MLFGAAQRFAIDGHRDLRHLRCWGQPADHTVGPGSQVRFELIAIHAPKDRVERGGTRGRVGEAEDFLPFVNPHLSHFLSHLHDRLTANPACIIARTLTQHGHQDTQESVANIA